MADYSMAGLAADYKQTQCYGSVYSDNPNLQQGHIEHNLCKLIWDQNTVGESITSSSGVTLTSNRAAGLTSLCTDWGTASNAPDATTKAIKDKLQNLYPDVYQEMIDLYVDLVLYMNDNPCGSSGYEPHDYVLSTETYDKNAITPARLLSRWENFWTTVENLKPENLYNEAHAKWQEEYDKYTDKYMNAADYTDVYDIDEALYYDGQYEYLSGLTSEQLDKLYEGEKYYATQLKVIQNINAKIEITQCEDKELELRLKQLDTEQDAIQTEMDAVQKVIEKNVESTFKIFG